MIISQWLTRDVAFGDMPSGVYGVTKIQNLYDFLYAKGVYSEKGCFRRLDVWLRLQM